MQVQYMFKGNLPVEPTFFTSEICRTHWAQLDYEAVAQAQEIEAHLEASQSPVASPATPRSGPRLRPLWRVCCWRTRPSAYT